MTETTAPIARILVPLDASPEASRALEAAATLAARLGRPLEAVFIEDADLLALAALPFTSEVSLSGRPAPAFDTARVERDLRVRARVLRGRVEQLALSYRVSYSFRVVRGRRAEALASLRQAGDLLALGVEQALRDDGAQLLTGAHCRLQAGPVVLLVGAAPEPTDLALAETLAHDSGQALLLLSGEPGAALPDRRVEPVPPDHLAARLQAQRGGLILARRALLPEAPEALARRLRVPLLLLG